MQTYKIGDIVYFAIMRLSVEKDLLDSVLICELSIGDWFFRLLVTELTFSYDIEHIIYVDMVMMLRWYWWWCWYYIDVDIEIMLK